MRTARAAREGAAPASDALSSGRPHHLASTEEVQMDMEDRLPGVLAVVEHEAVAARQPLLFCKLTCNVDQVSDQRLVRLLHVLDPIDRLLGNDQDVRRSLRIDVAEREAAIILVDDLGRDLAIDDLAEKSLRHARSVARTTSPLKQPKTQSAR